MLLDRIVLISVWIVTILGILLLTPREKIRDAHLVFMFKQVITWMFGLIVVEFKYIEYPIRIFEYATRTSFSFEYFIYPAVCIIFVLRFPKNKTILHKIGWYLLFPTWMTILEVLIERYTDLIHYINWSWYWTWLTLIFTFYLSRLYYTWYIKRCL